MLNIQENKSLKKYHTLGFDIKSKFFVEIKKEEQILELSQLIFGKKGCCSQTDYKKLYNFYFLGQGSNTFFTKFFDGIVILNLLSGISIVKEDKKNVFIKCGSGVIRDDVVSFVINNKYFGPENLVSIPGTVGASIVQNIGAYGVEISEFVERVDFIDIKTSKKDFFYKKLCKFGYRQSIFKQNPNLFITSVVYKFRKDIENYVPDVSYGSLGELFEKRNKNFKGFLPGLVADVISYIRFTKLPDLNLIGTAGSFFKNIFVDYNKFIKLKKKYSDLKGRNVGEGKYKLSSGQLIEKAVGKGFNIGGVGTYEKHALVLVNKGFGTVEEFHILIKNIKKKVFDIFGVELESEVVFV